MHIVFVGGTGFVGRAAVPLALEAGHRVTVAHTGTHELPEPLNGQVEHFHGSRAELLDPAGPVSHAHPEVLVDTFQGATPAKARQLAACAAACGARVVAISSVDVYQASLVAGMGDARHRSLLSPYRLPIREDAALRVDPFPLPERLVPPGFEHDNAATERALQASGIDAVVLRPGMIYGIAPTPGMIRESWLVRLAAQGVHRLELPWEGTQYFSRVAVERVARAVIAAAERAPDGYWACNVVDPYGWTFAGLAGEVGRLLDWEWEPVVTEWVNPFSDDPALHHPFNVPSPCWYADDRLRTDLNVTTDQPDPHTALEDTIRWLWNTLTSDTHRGLPQR